MASILSSCASVNVYSTSVENNLIQVPLDSFSIEEKMKIIRSKSLANDILLIRTEQQIYKAILMKCTHQDNILVLSNKRLTCNMHGSNFDLNGNALNGPASRPLKQFKVIQEANFINIYMS